MTAVLPIDSTESFSDLNINPLLLKALTKSGYTSPTPIQSQMIPHILENKDVVGQAQTGTGKTAAFALPLLNKLNFPKKGLPQILVLTPTRELALQVAESFQRYGEFLKHLKVVPIYGGEDYAVQLKQLKQSPQVIVGTPGRIMDHIRRGTLSLELLHSLVLDEGDEMLKMGFLDDVEWILEQTPNEKQVALFSATMPTSIRKIAQKYLNSPIEISIKNKTATASTIDQQYVLTKGLYHKKEALQRILEAEDFEGLLIFVRTRIQTVELAEFLTELGYSTGPLNGDIPQNQRLRMVEQLKSGKLDILVATDVAARGLDVERISHVINFDVPFDTEAYIHRIGRTGRAGRTGKAILFVHPREKSMLKAIERATRQKISTMKLPTPKEIQARRIEKYKNEISLTLATDLTFFSKLVEEYCQEKSVSIDQVAAALAKMSQEKNSLLPPKPVRSYEENKSSNKTKPRNVKRSNDPALEKRISRTGPPEKGMDRYRIEIGNVHGVKPGNIVGAIANEVDISSEHIGRISIFDNYSTVDLPYGMPKPILKVLKKVQIHDRKMHMQLEKNGGSSESYRSQKKRKVADKEARNSGRRRGQNKNKLINVLAK